MAGEKTTRRVDSAGGRPAGKVRLTLAPMIDVTFLLLLFFLMTFTFRQAEGGLPGSLPRLDGRGGEPSAMNVAVHSAGHDGERAVFRVEGEPQAIASGEQLYSVAGRQELFNYKLDSATIVPRGDVRWQHVVEAYNQLVRAKFSAIGFAPAVRPAGDEPVYLADNG